MVLGAWISEVKEYYAIDANNDLVNRYKIFNQEIYEITKDQFFKKVKIKFGDSSIFDESLVEKFDLIITSPPYFNKEEYSKDFNQSVIKYSDFNIWVEYFLKSMLKNCFEYLKKNGIAVIKINDILDENNKKIFLEKITIFLCENIGFKLIDIIKLPLSSSVKENIYIFKK